MKPDLRRRLSESIEAAAGARRRRGRGRRRQAGRRRPRPRERAAKGAKSAGQLPSDVAERLTFSERFACLNCGTSIPELEPRIFSFNSPHGACERCHGLGFQRVVDPELVVPDPTLSLSEGALQPWRLGPLALLEAAGRGRSPSEYGVDVDAPWQELSETRTARSSSTAPAPSATRSATRTASGDAAPTASASRGSSTTSSAATRRPTRTPSASGSRATWPSSPAPTARARLRPESLAVKVGGISIPEYTRDVGRAPRSSGSRTWR